MRIGNLELANNLVVAPMAGVTDRPFRMLCKRMGAGLAVSEMVAGNPSLWGSIKSRRRTDHTGEAAPISVQIAGADPQLLAETARYNVARGAQLIDINMGCPAKKVCNVMAGSALLQDELLVAQILEQVVAAVDVPVTLKFRTGWDKDHKNALTIARIAADAGIQALALHGRTRACGYTGNAEYETIAAVKASVAIPVIANGDINSPEKAAQVLMATGADGIMIGRAAQGRPWIFREMAYYLATGERLPPPEITEIREVLLEHLNDLYTFYGAETGLRIARKHIGWYTQDLVGGGEFRSRMNRIETAGGQFAAVELFLDELAASGKHLIYLSQGMTA